MSKFDMAKQFFDAREIPQGWGGCKSFVAISAGFCAQSEPLADMTSIEEYRDWTKAFGTVAAAGATYTLQLSAWDEETSTATFFATYHAAHVGKGGPVPPTNKSTNSHYVCVIQVGEDNLVTSLTKIWNAPWAMTELGWT